MSSHHTTDMNVTIRNGRMLCVDHTAHMRVHVTALTHTVDAQCSFAWWQIAVKMAGQNSSFIFFGHLLHVWWEDDSDVAQLSFGEFPEEDPISVDWHRLWKQVPLFAFVSVRYDDIVYHDAIVLIMITTVWTVWNFFKSWVLYFIVTFNIYDYVRNSQKIKKHSAPLLFSNDMWSWSL